MSFIGPRSCCGLQRGHPNTKSKNERDVKRLGTGQVPWRKPYESNLFPHAKYCKDITSFSKEDLRLGILLGYIALKYNLHKLRKA
ncbi:hypothetical protein Trydic_g16836 [Trypoxylus dichotomus]